jgi:outer membrane protein
MHPKTLLVAGAILLASATAVQAQSTLKVGYINSAVLLEEAPGAKEASEQFDRDLQGFYAEIQTMSEELQQLIEQYDRQQMMLSAAAKTQREEEINVRRQAYQTRVEQLEEQAGKRQQELVQPITERVNEVIEQLRAEQSYSFIFDVAAGSIIAADPALDLTPEVLRRLRAQAGR